MGDVDTLTVALFMAGGLLLFGAIKNKNPLDVIKNVLSGKSDAVNASAPLAGSTTAASGGQDLTAVDVGPIGTANMAGQIAGQLQNLPSIISHLLPYTTVTGKASPASPGAYTHSDGTPRFYPNGSPRYVNDPTYDSLPTTDPRMDRTPVSIMTMAPKDARR